MEKILKCEHCGTILGAVSFKTFGKGYTGVTKDRKCRLFCSSKCYEQYKKQFETEVYKGCPIYEIDYNGEHRFLPYFESHYYFLTLEDCRKRIDASVSLISF